MTIEGTDVPIVRSVAPHGGGIDAVVGECIGTAIVVETEEGELIGRVDEPACADWSLTINEDYSLTYEKD